MKRSISAFILFAVSMGCSTPVSSVSRSPSSNDFNSPLSLGPDESVITIVGSNDVHGHFLSESAQTDADENVPAAEKDSLLGGQQWFAGYVSAIRAANESWYGSKGTTLLLDAGDVAQGTLISNSNEGVLAAQLMNSLNYTAAIPGNHAYDFGPIDSNVDQCAIGDSKCDPLEALKRFQSSLKFPLLGANVKLAANPSRTAPFLKDYALVPFQGRNIAIIGLDNEGTPSTTYRMNVKSLAFTHGVQETASIVNKLKSKGLADIFVLVAHNGDMAGNSPLLDFLKALPTNPDGSPLIDAAIIGHTHIMEQGAQNGIPYVQSNWGGKYFGIIQIVVSKDPTTGKLVVQRDKTVEKAAIPIKPVNGTFMNQSVRPDPNLQSILSQAEKTVNSLSSKKIATLKSALSEEGKRLADSEIGNFVADIMRSAANADVAVIGSGDVRMGVEKPADGALIYNDLFNVLPKGLQLVTVPKMSVDMLIASLTLSIHTCGERGALQISGLTIDFERDCSKPVNGLDPKAKLVRVVTSSGAVVYPPSEATVQTLNVATTDFILTGGAGYTSFMKLISTPQDIRTVGPLRDLMVKEIEKLGTITNAPYVVGRYINKK